MLCKCRDEVMMGGEVEKLAVTKVKGEMTEMVIRRCI